MAVFKSSTTSTRMTTPTSANRFQDSCAITKASGTATRSAITSWRKEGSLRPMSHKPRQELMVARSNRSMFPGGPVLASAHATIPQHAHRTHGAALKPPCVLGDLVLRRDRFSTWRAHEDWGVHDPLLPRLQHKGPMLPPRFAMPHLHHRPLRNSRGGRETILRLPFLARHPRRLRYSGALAITLNPASIQPA